MAYNVRTGDTMTTLTKRPALAVLVGAFLAVGVACAAQPPDESSPAAVRSTPGPGGVVTIPFTSVRVWFNEETDPAQSSLALAGPEGGLSLVGVHSMGEGDLMAAVSGSVVAGDHTLTWTAVGADGETSTGDVRFTVVEAEADPDGNGR